MGTENQEDATENTPQRTLLCAPAREAGPDDEYSYEHVKLKPVRTVEVKYVQIGKLAARIMADQEPLGAEFEEVWDANKGILYEP